MKLSGYLIEKFNDMGNSYTCSRLLEEARKQNIELKMIGACDSFITDDGCYNGVDKLKKADFVINRYKYGKVKDALNELGRKSYNALPALNVYINKSEQLKNIKSSYFKKPRYISGFTDLPFELPVDDLGVPFIAKGLESSMGREIFLIENKKQYADLKNIFPASKEWIFEKFIAESKGHDIRVFCLRGEAVAAMERRSNVDFRANVALGARVKNMPINPEFQYMAADIYKQTGLDVIGLDLLEGKDGFYFCEINVTPGLQGIEQATGINIAAEAMKLIGDDFDAD